MDLELIKKMVSTPFDGQGNALFTGIFNALGVLPAVYASLLLPGSKGQKIPALPFVLGSFVGGFFFIGPYLFLRNKKVDVTTATKGIGSSAFESKLSAVGLLAFSSYLYYYAIIQGIPLAWPGYLELFNTQGLVGAIDDIVIFVVFTGWTSIPLPHNMLIKPFMPY